MAKNMEEKLPKKISFSFLPIPEELMKSKALSFGAKFLFGIIAKANREGVKWPISYLSKRMGCGNRETQKRIKELEECNLIKVIPNKGKVNEYCINLELIQIIQTPEQTGRGEQDVQGGGEHPVHPIKDSNIKETSKEGNSASPVAKIRNFFIEECKKRKGIEPEMAFGKEGRLLKEKLKRYTPEQLIDLIDKFLNSNVGEKLGWTLSICLSAPVINQWLAGRLEKPKRPYFQGKPMRQIYGRWQVLVDGEWLEFAGSEKEIIYQ